MWILLEGFHDKQLRIHRDRIEKHCQDSRETQCYIEKSELRKVADSFREKVLEITAIELRKASGTQNLQMLRLKNL